jgi:signal transduction histidine kinase
MSVQPPRVDTGGEPGALGIRNPGRVLVLGTLAYFLLGLLGRATIVDDHALSLVWPAAGASMMLFALLPTRKWGLAAGVLALATVVLNMVTGATGTEAAIFVAANLSQAMSGVLVLRALAPGLIGPTAVRPLDQLRDFWAVLAGCIGGSLVGAAVGILGRLLLLDGGPRVDVFVWWGRNAVGATVVLTSALLLWAAWTRLREQVAVGVDVVANARALARHRGLEAALLGVLTLAVYAVVFVAVPSLPVLFSLLVPTVWAGMRFSPLAVATHSVVLSAAVVVVTLRGHGPFASPDHWQQEVLISQAFLGLVFCLGMLLALGRSERLALTHNLLSSRAASESQARLMSTIIDTMHDGVTVLDESGQVLQRNPAGAQMVRTSPDELHNINEVGFRILTPDGRPMLQHELPWVRAMNGDAVVARDLVVEFEDGSPSRTLAVSARRLPTPAPNGLRQAVVVYHDVTADRAQRSELESFASVVAHDLLGPLGVVDGWTEMLDHDLETDGTLSLDDAAPKLDRIRTAAAGMRKLIEDLLESSTSRDAQLRTTVVDLEKLARTVAQQHLEVTPGPGPTIEIGPLPRVYADATTVRQVLDNLIGNAVKYVVPGEVPVVRVTGRRLDDLVEVTVADEGVGIPADQRDRIFEAFHRAHAGRGYAGHGIGLSVCKRIVERHGGRIYVKAPEGERGTRIVFTLPAAHAGYL